MLIVTENHEQRINLMDMDTVVAVPFPFPSHSRSIHINPNNLKPTQFCHHFWNCSPEALANMNPSPRRPFRIISISTISQMAATAMGQPALVVALHLISVVVRHLATVFHLSASVAIHRSVHLATNNLTDSAAKSMKESTIKYLLKMERQKLSMVALQRRPWIIQVTWMIFSPKVKAFNNTNQKGQTQLNSDRQRFDIHFY